METLMPFQYQCIDCDKPFFSETEPETMLCQSCRSDVPRTPPGVRIQPTRSSRAVSNARLPFIPVMVPKTATTSLCKSITASGIGNCEHVHLSVLDYQAIAPKHMGKYTFAVIRNPLERILSQNAYIKRKTLPGKDYWKKGVRCLEELLEMIIRKPENANNNIVLRPQYQFVADSEGTIIPDLWPMEKLQQLFSHLCSTYNAPKQTELSRDNTARPHHLERHTETTIEMTRLLYKEDFTLYNHALSTKGATQ